jgi:glycosyltransferase involved in cell wall biosynthesis
VPPLVGHFGTFGAVVAGILVPAVMELMRLAPAAGVLLIGRESDRFRERFVAAHPEWAARVHATGELPPVAVSAHLRACELLLQPFPDGISSRRTSAMAGLSNGVPVTTNLGVLSEPLWAGGAVAAVSSPDPVALANLAVSLLVDPVARGEVGRRGSALYRGTFAPEHTIARLQGTA